MSGLDRQAEKALNLVPNLNAEDKVRAALLWNILSTKLQTIIDASAQESQIHSIVQQQEQEPLALVEDRGTSDDIHNLQNLNLSKEDDLLNFGTTFTHEHVHAHDQAEVMARDKTESSLLLLDTQSISGSTLLSSVPCGTCDIILLEDEEKALEKVVEEVITLENEEEDRKALEQGQSSRSLPNVPNVNVPNPSDTQTQTKQIQVQEKPQQVSKPQGISNLNLNKTKSWSCLTCSQVFEDVQDYEGNKKSQD